MDVPQDGGRRSRRSGKRRKTRTQDGETIITKDGPVPGLAPAPAPAPAPTPTKIIPQKVILAPPKKKAPKVMLVPKGQTVARTIPRKTFKAKRVKVTIDNTAKTQKQRRTLLATVDACTDDQIRAAAVKAGLSRHETVAKAPIGLLRQMVKDYQTMKGLLL